MADKNYLVSKLISQNYLGKGKFGEYLASLMESVIGLYFTTDYIPRFTKGNYFGDQSDSCVINLSLLTENEIEDFMNHYFNEKKEIIKNDKKIGITYKKNSEKFILYFVRNSWRIMNRNPIWLNAKRNCGALEHFYIDSEKFFQMNVFNTVHNNLDKPNCYYGYIGSNNICHIQNMFVKSYFPLRVSNNPELDISKQLHNAIISNLGDTIDDTKIEIMNLSPSTNFWNLIKEYQKKYLIKIYVYESPSIKPRHLNTLPIMKKKIRKNIFIYYCDGSMKGKEFIEPIVFTNIRAKKGNKKIVRSFKSSSITKTHTDNKKKLKEYCEQNIIPFLTDINNDNDKLIDNIFYAYLKEFICNNDTIIKKITENSFMKSGKTSSYLVYFKKNVKDYIDNQGKNLIKKIIDTEIFINTSDINQSLPIININDKEYLLGSFYILSKLGLTKSYRNIYTLDNKLYGRMVVENENVNWSSSQVLELCS